MLWRVMMLSMPLLACQPQTGQTQVSQPQARQPQARQAQVRQTKPSPQLAAQRAAQETRCLSIAEKE